MKTTQAQKLQRLWLAVLFFASAGVTYAQVPDLTIQSFDSGTPGVQPSGCGIWFGSGAGAFDTVDDSGNGGGSLYVSCVFTSGSDTPTTEYICYSGDNPWYNPHAISMSLYKSVQFDLLWDNSLSDITIDQFNDLSTFPTNYLTPGGSLAGSIAGIELLAANGNGTPAFAHMTNFNIPTGASNGWVHIKLPINPSAAGIDGGSGIVFHKWANHNNTISGTHYANFWVDNVFLEGTAAPPPPPTLSAPVKAVQGLNVFASTPGIYDRQEAQLIQTNGLCWIGHATALNPVSYSFTIKDLPTDAATAYGIEAYLFLVPNPNANYNAPDWNLPNCVIASVQHNPNGSAYMNLQYKVDEANGNDMIYGNPPYTNAPGSWDGVTNPWYERGNLGSVGNPTPIGTWTVQFTSDTNVALISPNGTSNSFILPPYNAAKFAAETNFSLFLGMQANNSASLNKAVVYSSFAVSGSPSAYSENFLAESSLSTNLWRTSLSTGPQGVRIIPSTGVYWINWTLPDAGFSLQAAASVLGPFNAVTNGPKLGMVGQRSQLISDSELPSPGAGFFRLIK